MQEVIDFRLAQSLRDLISRVATLCREHGITAYVTGGFMRDLLRDAPVRDIDLVIDAEPWALGSMLADALAGDAFRLDEERGVVRVLVRVPDVHVDLAPIRGTVEDDMWARDFTVDAIAASLADVEAGSGILVDPTGGLVDLRAKQVRLVLEAALSVDPLRLLRGPRIAMQLAFEIQPTTAEAIVRHAHLLPRSAAERQRDELLLILSQGRAGDGLRSLDDLGLLPHLIPEMEVTRGVEQPKEHHWDVLGHSFAAVDALDLLLQEAQPSSSPQAEIWRQLWAQLAWWPGAREYFAGDVVPGSPRAALLKLTAFLHDIGKPSTKTIADSGRMRFFGHSEAGADLAVRFMRRLRFSSRETTLVHAMIHAHLRPIQMAQQGPPSRRAMYRFFRDTGDGGIDTLFLSLADHLATVGPRVSLDGWKAHVALVDVILRNRLGASDTESRWILDGHDIMAELGLPPGPLVGRLRELAREAQAVGEVTTRQQALDLLRRRLAEHAPKSGSL